MREILFRGKSVDNGEWVYGYYTGPIMFDQSHEICDINDPVGSRVEVHEHTVGQYTGYDDKCGNKIFEGDIVRDDTNRLGFISFLQQSAGWCIVWKGYDTSLGHRSRQGSTYFQDVTLEIVGNVHENSELLSRCKE